MDREPDRIEELQRRVETVEGRLEMAIDLSVERQTKLDEALRQLDTLQLKYDGANLSLDWHEDKVRNLERRVEELEDVLALALRCIDSSRFRSERERITATLSADQGSEE